MSLTVNIALLPQKSIKESIAESLVGGCILAGLYMNTHIVLENVMRIRYIGKQLAASQKQISDMESQFDDSYVSSLRDKNDVDGSSVKPSMH